MQENFDSNINEEMTEEEFGRLPEENETQPSEIEELKQQVGEEKDKFIRLYAEFENFKKRTAKERLEYFTTANENLLLDLMPVLDDFERAKGQMEQSGDENLVQGVSLIQNKLMEVLKNKGLKKVEVTQGDDFDADTQEAVTQIPAPSPELAGKVVDVIETGYQLGDKIIRYPKVVVGK